MTTASLRGVLQALVHELRDLDPEYLTQDEQVTIGHLLWSIGQEAKSALEPLKTLLRESVLRESPAPGAGRLKGEGRANCLVVVQAPRPVLRKDKDPADLIGVLKSRFPAYFDTCYRLRKDFEQTATSNPKEATTVLTVVGYQEGPPRVTFKDGA